MLALIWNSPQVPPLASSAWASGRNPDSWAITAAIHASGRSGHAAFVWATHARASAGTGASWARGPPAEVPMHSTAELPTPRATSTARAGTARNPAAPAVIRVFIIGRHLLRLLRWRLPRPAGRREGVRLRAASASRTGR